VKKLENLRSALRKYLGRRFLGTILLGVNWLTRGKPIARDAEHQTRLDAALAPLSLYHFRDCPFCIKVRRYIHQSNIALMLRDAEFNDQHRNDLISQGGHYQVPCLRVPSSDGGDDQWLYESDDIIVYLDKIICP
jgi:glutaredoxin